VLKIIISICEVNNRTCHYCQEIIVEGRRDKKYCNAHCRSANQYAQSVKSEPIFHKVKKALLTNRKIMKRYNVSGLASTRKETLLAEGFNPRFTNHSWKNKKGDEYKIVYEFGFLETIVNGTIKYKLITWQNYMS